MGFIYDYHKREPDNTWLIEHIKVLLEEAKKNKNASFVIYATLESRNLLEKTEYDLMLMGTEKSEWESIALMAKGKNGLDKTNSKYKSLNYRYQTFSEAISKVLLAVELKIFNYKVSDELKQKLSEYLHTYTKSPDELLYESEFIQNGVKSVSETLSFITSYYTKTIKGYVIGIMNFSSLSSSMRTEFESWKKDVSEDTKGLYDILKEINDREAGGAKAQFVE